MPSVGSLFTGIGGFDLGFELEGFTPSWQAEIDAHCNTILERHWPNVVRVNDVRKAGRQLSNVDVLVGGFPCQDLSVAGRRRGLAGERSGLWFEFRRVITELRPKYVVIENVPGLLSSNEGKDFAIVIGGLTGTIPNIPANGWGNSGFARGNYNVAWRVLDAQYFGVPQRRRRVFLVASLGDGSCAQILFERESLSGSTPPSRQAGQGYSPVVGTLAASGSGLDRPSGNGNALDFCIPVAGTLSSAASGHMPASHNNELDFLVPMGFGNKEGNISGCVTTTWAKGHGGPSGDEAYNLTVLPSGVRRLTPLEAERLQGFPDNWTDGQPDTVRYKQAGNAVCVKVIRWIASRMKQHLQEERK